MDKISIKVLIVEDEESIRKFITINLSRNGFKVFEAMDGKSALEAVKEIKPDVVVLDIGLPDIDGFEVLRTMRNNLDKTAVIMLSARTQDFDKLMGLDFGADDYMTKPFNPLELIARIRAVLRRYESNGTEKLLKVDCGSIIIDFQKKKFFKNSVSISLTPTEFSIVEFLAKKRGIAVSRDDLVNSIWGKNYFGDIKTLDVHINRLREKIEDIPKFPKVIETVWGFGYRFSEEP